MPTLNGVMPARKSWDLVTFHDEGGKAYNGVVLEAGDTEVLFLCDLGRVRALVEEVVSGNVSDLDKGCNQRPKNKTSGFRGVHRKSGRKRWTAEIRVDGVARYLGNHETEQEAAQAYIKGAKELRGEDLTLGDLIV